MESIATELASPMAFVARVSPMIMAIGPVIVGGRIFSMTSRPAQFTRKHAMMDTNPLIITPNVA